MALQGKGVAVAAAIALLSAPSARAAITTYTDRVAFEAAASALGAALSQEGFESQAPNVPGNVPVAFVGGAASCGGCSELFFVTSTYRTAGLQSLWSAGLNSTSFTFDAPINVFGVAIADFGDNGKPATLTVTLPDGDLTPFNGFSGPNLNELFFGVIDTTAFATITFSGSVLGDVVLFDEMQFGAVRAAPTPEPTSWALMIVGLGLAGSALRGRGDRPSTQVQPCTCSSL